MVKLLGKAISAYATATAAMSLFSWVESKVSREVYPPHVHVMTGLRWPLIMAGFAAELVIAQHEDELDAEPLRGSVYLPSDLPWVYPAI